MIKPTLQTSPPQTAQEQLSVLVVGASRGIGAATAQRYLEEGYLVAGTHRVGGSVPEGVVPFVADVRARAEVAAAVKGASAHFGGRLDVLVYNAGLARQDLLLRMSEEALGEVMETNLYGAVWAVQAAQLVMSRHRSGSIVLISSESSRTGIPGSAHYTASKAALEGLIRSAMWELGGRGIRINGVAPGPTETDMLAKIEAADRQKLVESSPLGRIGDPAEVAEAIMRVSELTYLNGALIPVTGGEGLGF